MLRVRVLAELRRAWPYALALALLLGAVVSLGAHLSNAFPSRERPFGWAGPANFENAVAMVRPDILLAATLPALLLGATALRERAPRTARVPDVLVALAVDALLVALACFVGSLVAWFVAAKSPVEAFVAFGSATALVALAFYSLAFLVSAIVPRHALAPSLVVWGFFNFLYEGWTRVVLFRQVGYEPLASGNFPAWFWASQAFSPLTAYRGVLILWRRGFMDYLEKAALGSAALPAWMNPGTFALLMVGLWILVPLGLGVGIWAWRGRDYASDVAAPTSL